MIITLGGDICITDSNRESFAKAETKKLFGDVCDVYAAADINIVNLECAITDSDNAIKKFGPNLKAPKGTATVLKEAGVTHCGLSNNHTFDFGIEGLLDTTKSLDEVGITYTGIGKNDTEARKDLIIEKDGKKIAIIAVCEHEYSYALPDRIGAREYDPYDTNDDIAAARKNADLVIVMYHGGKELCRYPSPRLRKLCRSMVTHGADIVLCQHSHCIGCYEEVNGSHIVYGTGNFHFATLKGFESEMWSTGLLIKLDYTDKCKIEFMPVVNDGQNISLAKGELKERLLTEMAERNDELKDDRWLAGWHDFCVKSKGENPAYASPLVDNNFDLFAHYLDCEAHTDVWRELYPTWNKTNEK